MSDKQPWNFKFPFQEAFEKFTVNPVTSWQRFFNPQFYITYNSADVEVENNVLQRVGSYGKQLGRLIDVLNVLVARLPPQELTGQERLVLDRFKELSRKVDLAVAEVNGPKPPENEVTPAEVDRLVEGLNRLARTDPAVYQVMVDQLRKGLSL